MVIPKPFAQARVGLHVLSSPTSGNQLGRMQLGRINHIKDPQYHVGSFPELQLFGIVGTMWGFHEWGEGRNTDPNILESCNLNLFLQSLLQGLPERPPYLKRKNIPARFYFESHR